MHASRILIPLALALPTLLAAQRHAAGTWHLGVGASLGLHATHYENAFTVPGTSIVITDANDDGAVTTTFPFEVHYGLMDRLSLGLYVEPGAYVDSADTHPNRILAIGISPRFYIVNNDRFNWMALLDLGTTNLAISPAGQPYTDRYAGGHFRLGTGVSFYFGDHFGLQLFAKYAAYNLPWRERDPDPGITGFIAELSTRGGHLGAGLSYRLGR